MLTDLLKTVIWPFVTLIGLLLFRESLGNFLSGISGRVSKLSAFGTTVELATLPTAKALSAPRLDELKPAGGAIAGDASGSLLRSLTEGSQADYIQVDLGDGQEWISSRLFILAALIPRVRPIKLIVYTKGSDCQFLGVSTPRALSSALARRSPWLEAIYISAHVVLTNPGPLPPIFVNDKWLNLGIALQPDRSLIGPIWRDDAQNVLTFFLQQLQTYTDPAKDDWTLIEYFSYSVLTRYWEHAEWVTSDILVSMLGTELDPKSVKRDPSQDATVTTRTLLRHEEDYVPVVDTANRFLRLVDRRSAIDELTNRWLSGS